MLSFLFKLLFIVLVARLLAGFLRLFRPKKGEVRQRRRPEPNQVPPHLGEDIVDADFEDVEKKP